MTLGTLIRTKRTARGLSLDAVAAITGVSKSTLSRVERDMLEPAFALTVQLSKVLRVSLTTMAQAARETP